MKNLYDDEPESVERFSGNKSSADELPLKWKEAVTQLEYGFDTNTSSLMLFGDIGIGSLYDITVRIKALLHIRNEEDKDKPISIIINSDGGDVYEALGIIDYIQSLDVKVNTICRGRAMSAAALILCAGTGVRAASKNSTIMFHELSSGIYGKSSDMKANVQQMEKLEDLILKLVSQNSKKDKKFWEDSTSKDYYLTPEESLELGVIDTIIEPKHNR